MRANVLFPWIAANDLNIGRTEAGVFQAGGDGLGGGHGAMGGIGVEIDELFDHISAR